MPTNEPPTIRPDFMFRILACACICFCAGVATAQPQPGEYGDAPDGAVAYPSLGVLGNFPTCIDPFGNWVGHGAMRMAWFGQDVDFENDGDGGICFFGPYDQDECAGPSDLDAGLQIATSYTIDPAGNVVTTCSPSLSPYIGDTCQIISWGSSIDIWLTNNAATACVVNVLIDWNRDGQWGGTANCTSGLIEEHVVQNVPVPVGFSGPLSALNPPDIFTGPDRGYFWTRFTICPQTQAPLIGWNGAGDFDIGETEDYLLAIGPGNTAGEMGDAPHGVLAYPLNGIYGNFPTCFSFPGGHVLHTGNQGSWFGAGVDFEGNGNADLCSFTQYDHDECDRYTGDAGLIMPDVFTIDPGLNIVPCTSGLVAELGAPCQRLAWGTDIDIEVVNNSADPRWVNVLMDWDNSGTWGQTVTCANGDTDSEHVLQDFRVPGGYTGPLSALAPPGFEILGGDGHVWSRFTISEQPVGTAAWDGTGTFADGETEDYLFLITDPLSGTPPAYGFGNGLRLDPSFPNPFNPNTEISFRVATPGLVQVTVLDMAGNRIAKLLDADLTAGDHRLTWKGRADDGRPVASGTYLVKVVAGGEVRTGKVTMVK